MLRITIRELILLTALVGTGVAFWLECRQNVELRRENKSLDESLRLVTASLDEALDQIPSRFTPIYSDDSKVRVRSLSAE